MEQDRVCMKKGSNTKACTPGFKQKKKPWRHWRQRQMVAQQLK